MRRIKIMLNSTPPVRHFGHTFIEHRLPVPWEPADPHSDTFELFAREIYADGGGNHPVLVFLQGGPGFSAGRPLSPAGWLGEVLKHYRVLLLDQRGTGNSHRIDAVSDPADRTVERLSVLRQEYIVADAEALRRALGIDQWALFGQSFGGFCITAYLSAHPESISEAYLTGGLPTISQPIDEVYRSTYTKLTKRQEEFFKHIPWANDRIREIAHHLDNSAELLPTGERLSSRRFRTLGINLGRGPGYLSLAYLLENPFVTVRGEKRLKRDFLFTVGAQVSFEAAPLYAAIHEAIYGGVGGADRTQWSAHRIREEIPGYEETADPRSADKFYLTGEHIYPWQFEEDPALHAFAEGATALAGHSWQRSPYDAETLGSAASPTAAAAVYFDDIFVPLELSLETAQAYRDARLHVTNFYQHDGIGHDGAGILNILRDKLRDH